MLSAKLKTKKELYHKTILILTLRERIFKRAGTETCPYISKNPQN
jgi:hypothetical protein